MPILNGEAEITGLESTCVLELPAGQFWTTGPELHRQMFFGDVHGGTLAYHRRLVQEGLRYPELNLAEDAWLLSQAMAGGKRLLRLANPGLFVYVRHGSNAWGEWEPGSFLNPDGWSRIGPPRMFPSSILTAYSTMSIR
jgi:hypothetical protein